MALVCPERGALGRLADRLGKGGQPIEQLVEDRNTIIKFCNFSTKTPEASIDK